MEQRQIRTGEGSPVSPFWLNPPLRSFGAPQSRAAMEQFPFDDTRLSSARPTSTGRDFPAASLLFATGSRPCADQVCALAGATPSFRVSFDPGEGTASCASHPAGRWLELLANGLPFDLLGLAPGASQAVPPSTHQYGLPASFNVGALEAISLQPEAHIASVAGMLPVVRGLAWLTAMLADLPGIVAVYWHAARTVSASEHFRGSVLSWVKGGAFPGLGLTALESTPDGGFQSEGLQLFTGQELRLSPELAGNQVAGARLSLRLLHWMVEHGRLEAPVQLAGVSGEPLLLKPSRNRRLVQVSRA